MVKIPFCFHRLICIGLLVTVSAFPKEGMASNKMDSLWGIWNDSSAADTTRLKAMHAIAWKYIFHNPDSAYLLAEEELSLAKEKALI